MLKRLIQQGVVPEIQWLVLGSNTVQVFTLCFQQLSCSVVAANRYTALAHPTRHQAVSGIAELVPSCASDMESVVHTGTCGCIPLSSIRNVYDGM